MLPLVALVFGTAAIGSELEDGTAVYLLAKPMPRWAVVLAKLVAAGGLTAALIAPAALVTGLVLAGDQGDGAGIAVAYAVASVVGSFLYAAVFLALSIAHGPGPDHRPHLRRCSGRVCWPACSPARAPSASANTPSGSPRSSTPDRSPPRSTRRPRSSWPSSCWSWRFALASRWLSGYQLRAAE